MKKIVSIIILLFLLSLSDIYAQSSAFVDDVWYFGENKNGSAAKSAGIRFVKNSLGQYVAQDASGESMVYSWENSLVVSSPYCDGQILFYASHNQLYNNLHQPMSNGAFTGNRSIADGLAACYMGDNKYLFFTVTNIYDYQKQLRAYVVDMNADNGKGARIAISNEIVEGTHYNMPETIELIAKAGTTNQYWLVYPHRNSGTSSNNYTDEIRVRLVDVSNPSIPLIGGGIHFRIGKTNDKTHIMKVSQQNNRIAVANYYGGTTDVFDFNDTTGILSNKQTISGIGANTYGVEFSPDGNQLYCAICCGNSSSNIVCQYDISGTPTKLWQVAYGASQGGGLKLGPDGKIYVVKSASNTVGVISNPNNASTSLTSRYNTNGLTLGVTYNTLTFSTGLTKPSVLSNTMNTAPTTQADSTIMCVTSSSSTRTVKVNVLKNDSDADNDTIFLTNAYFVNSTDNNLATLTVNAIDSSITLTINSSTSIPAAGRVFEIIYDVKDDGVPASQCASGHLKITAYNTATPTIITASGITCSGTSAILTASASANVINPVFKWYTLQTEATPFHTGASYTTANLTENATYYVSVSGDNYCENPMGSRREVTVTVAPYSTPSTFTANGTSICSGTAATLTASTSTVSAPVFKWYASQTEATPFHTGASYTTSALTADTTLYVSVSGTNYCENNTGSRKEVKVTVYPLPVVSILTTEFCAGITTTLSPDTGGFWTSNDESIATITDNRTVTGISEGTARLTYTSSTTNCSEDIAVTVRDFPDVDEITGKAVVCTGQSIELSNTAPNGSWTSNNANVTFDNPAANPVTVTGATEGKTFVTYTVSNGMCQTKRTHQLKIISNKIPNIIIGIER